MPPKVVEQPVHVLLELPRQPRLADAGDPDDREQMTLALVRARMEELLREAHLPLTPDERRFEAARSHEAFPCRNHPHRPPKWDRFGFSFEDLRVELLVSDRSFG